MDEDDDDIDKPAEEPGEVPQKPTLIKPIAPEPSSYEQQSVGRLYFNLSKLHKLTRWKKLPHPTVTLQNVLVWWEIHEKHEEELEAIESAEEAEAEATNDNDEKTTTGSSGGKRPKKGKKKGKKKNSKKSKATNES